jgi:hypothetical protein
MGQLERGIEGLKRKLAVNITYLSVRRVKRSGLYGLNNGKESPDSLKLKRETIQ